MIFRMKTREDDTTENTGQPQPETGEPGKYYYDDATGYEIYEPTTALEDDEPDDQAPKTRSGGC